MKKLLQYFNNDNVKFILNNNSVIKTALLLVCNGFNKKSFEIIRLSINLKQINKKIKELKKLHFVKNHNLERNREKVSHDTIWICWFQGVDTAPDLVKKCIISAERLENKKVIILNSENINDYITLPDYIIDKWHSGAISYAHFSDLIRMELLYQHGGIWLDSTVFLSSKVLPDYLENSWLFFYQPLKPGRNGNSINISSWAMSAAPANPVLGIARDYFFAYWKEKNKLEDYFLFHIVLASILDIFPPYSQCIDKVCNSTPHILLLELNTPFSENRLSQIFELSSIHKLTYKYSQHDCNKNSFLFKILEGEI